MDSKIVAQHLQRIAGVYVRQSSMHQVRENTASTELQYNLAERAVALGWPREAVRFYDGDLGVSGKTPEQREAFRQLVVDVGLGTLGIVIAFDATRLSRNNTDWHRLLELCSVRNTLIADLDGVYDLALYNDRFLLGMKGTMSEAEHHLIQTRLRAGIERRVAAGELRRRLPAGYDWSEAGEVRLAADESVRHAIALVLQKFAELGSGHAVMRYLQNEGIQLPSRCNDEVHVRWNDPRYNTVRRIIGNPFYAGAYVYGRSRRERTVDDNGCIRMRSRKAQPSEWKVVIKDHHPGYITWTQFDENQRRLAENALANSPGEASKVLREGAILLQGLVSCGICGRKMRPQYSGPKNSGRYICDYLRRNHGSEQTSCQSLSAKRIDDAVVEAFLDMLSPASMQVTLAALDELDQQEDAALRHLEQRREKARYEADRARRQFDAVEPENRLVARTLEREWNRCLAELAKVEQQITTRRAQEPPALTPAERQQALDLGLDLRRVWDAETTTPQVRKQLLRAALDDVVVTVDRPAGRARVTLLWQGGRTTELEVNVQPPRGQGSLDDQAVVENVRKMAEVLTDTQIANTLGRRGARTATGLTFTAERVRSLRRRYDIPQYEPVNGEGEEPVYTATEAARELGVCHVTVLRWLSEGFLVGEQASPWAPWRIRLGASVRLKVAEQPPEGWLPVAAGAKALGVSREAVLHSVQAGKLDAVLAGRGRRKALRINVNTSSSKTIKQQPDLFDQPSDRGDA